MKKIWCLSFLLACGCSSATNKQFQNKESSASKSQIAVLHSARLNTKSLTFEVLSYGCSKNSHFKLDYSQVEQNKVSITVIRLRPDLCKKKPELKLMELPLRGILNEKSIVSVTNPFRAYDIKSKY